MVHEINLTELWKLTWISGIPFLWGSFSLHNLHKSLDTLDIFHHEPKKTKTQAELVHNLMLQKLPKLSLLSFSSIFFLCATNSVEIWKPILSVRGSCPFIRTIYVEYMLRYNDGLPNGQSGQVPRALEPMGALGLKIYYKAFLCKFECFVN